jgi:signal transduction histidine kinase
VPVIDPRAFDAVLMLAFLAVAQVDIWAPWGDNGDQTVFEHRGVSSALMVVGIVPMLWRRRAPLVSAAALAAAMSVQVTLVYPTAAFVGAFVPMLVVTYSVAAYEERLDRALAGLTITVAGVLVVTLRIPELRSFSEVPFEIACLACAWLVGRFVFGLRDRAREARRRATDLEAQREREAREAVDRERARIARELHDVIAHSVSLMGIQAAAAEQVLAGDPERAREPLRAIQETARDAVEELRRLLGMLRADADGDALSPQPGLASLEPLAEQMRAAGLPVDLRVEAEGDHLSPGVELSVYRIVQEALTNALKHAGGAAAAVLVRRREGALEVEISDDGRGAGAAPGGDADEVGHGLIGMRERVALYDGSISAGPDEDGGYRVRASLPDPRQP